MNERADGTQWPWRLAVGVSGLLLFAGGGMHPDAPEGLGFRESLAAMMADDAWVPGHSLMAIGAVALLMGLVLVRRADAWPAASRLLPAAVVISVANVVEAVFHTASVVDKEQLAAGGTPPVAFIHLALAVVVYPAFGLTIAALAWKLSASWSPALRAVSAAGVIGGLMHASSAPLVILTQNDAFDVLFLGAIPIAVWSVVLGIAGLRAAAPTTTRAAVPA